MLKKDAIAVELFAKYKEARMPNLRVGEDDMNALMNFLASDGKDTISEQKTEAVELKAGAGLKETLLTERHFMSVSNFPMKRPEYGSLGSLRALLLPRALAVL